jgi:type II secretory pathway pseudopilin PulG
MTMNARRDLGETLIEVVLTIIIISLTIVALISSLATVSNAGTAQRNGVQIDLTMRNYAEATKAAVQGCVEGSTYTVTYLAPTGFTPTVLPTGNICPLVSSPTLLQLTVIGPSGSHATMKLKVRTP